MFKTPLRNDYQYLEDQVKERKLHKHISLSESDKIITWISLPLPEIFI